MNDLYRMFDRAGRLLYVGISFNAGERATQHAETKPWWPQVDHIRIEHLECSREDALRKERWTIHAEKPIHNIHHNTGRNEYTPRGASCVPFCAPEIVRKSEEWQKLKRALHGFLTGICRERDEHPHDAEQRRLLAGASTSALDFNNLDVVGLIAAVTMACHQTMECPTCWDALVPDIVSTRSGDSDTLIAYYRCPDCDTDDTAPRQLISIKDAA